MEDSYVTVDGIKLHYLKTGKGRPLLFIHGHRSDAFRWIKIIEKAAQYFTVYAPDLPGFGKSQQLKVCHKLSNYTPLLIKFVDKMGLKKYTISGGSMGGDIAIFMAERQPEKIEKLILINPLYNRSSLKIRKAKILSALAILSILPKAHVYKFFDWFIKKDKIFKPFLKSRFPKEERTDDIINYETRQWRIMSIKVWAQTLLDLLKTDLSKVPPINIQSKIFLSGDDQYFKVNSEIAGFTRLLPNCKIIVIPHVPHVTKGDIPDSLLKKFDKYFKEI